MARRRVRASRRMCRRVVARHSRPGVGRPERFPAIANAKPKPASANRTQPATCNAKRTTTCSTPRRSSNRCTQPPTNRWCGGVRSCSHGGRRVSTRRSRRCSNSRGASNPKLWSTARSKLWRRRLPCGIPRIGASKVFNRDLTVGMVAASGIGAFNDIGDSEGVWIGTAPPDHSLVWLDPQGASKENKPPSMGVVGEPGAGKTFLLAAHRYASHADGVAGRVYQPEIGRHSRRVR